MMINIKKTIVLSGLIGIGILLFSCQKAYLDKRPQKSLLVPSSLSDFQALMDNLQVFNVSPGVPEISADDLEINDAEFNGFPDATEKNAYTWAADVFGGEPSWDWSVPYQQVFYANVVLDGLNTLAIDPATQTSRNTIKGSALFYRAYAFYNLVQAFAKGYDKQTAATDLGIPLRLTADVNAKVSRATVGQTYEQITGDLAIAADLLPARTAFKSRPSKTAAEALMARVYLSMQVYDKAADHASAALLQNNTLLDYNDLDTSATSPFPYAPANDNAEMIFYDVEVSYYANDGNYSTVSDALYQSYPEDDLRRYVFFTRAVPRYFKGRYTGSVYSLFGGLSVDELYLVRAECKARSGAANEALSDLNTLLVKRWKKGAFVPLTAANAAAALERVLAERRKELAFRGLRWGDLKRLNMEQRFAKALTRTVNGKTYTLPANDKRYVLPIPVEEIKASGIPQNER